MTVRRVSPHAYPTRTLGHLAASMHGVVERIGEQRAQLHIGRGKIVGHRRLHVDGNLLLGAPRGLCRKQSVDHRMLAAPLGRSAHHPLGAGDMRAYLGTVSRGESLLHTDKLRIQLAPHAHGVLARAAHKGGVLLLRRHLILQKRHTIGFDLRILGFEQSLEEKGVQSRPGNAHGHNDGGDRIPLGKKRPQRERADHKPDLARRHEQVDQTARNREIAEQPP